jgi:hypothetical protein
MAVCSVHVCREIVARLRQHLTPDRVAAYQKQGFLHVPGLLRADEVALLARGLDENAKHLSPRAKILSNPTPGAARFAEDFRNFSRYVVIC